MGDCKPADLEVSVRAARKEDLPALATLFNEYRMFYWQADDPVLAREFLAQRMQREESVIFVATDVDEKLVGFTQLFPTFSSVSAKPAWILNDLFVATAARRRGVGKALMAQVLAHGRHSGAAWISLQTGHDNRAAQALYEKFGFVPDQYYTSYSHTL